MGMYTYETKGICARTINFQIENGIIHKVVFVGGCSGNTQGVSRLIEGMAAEEAIRKLRGIDCGGKGTSCPDQLAKALEEVILSTKKVMNG